MSSIAILYNRLKCCFLYSYLIHVQKVVRKAEEKFWKQLTFLCISKEDSASKDKNHNRHIYYSSFTKLEIT